MILDKALSLPVQLQLGCVGGLLAVTLLALFGARVRLATPIVYTLTMAICGLAAAGALAHLLAGSTPARADLPIGLPWIGAHFRLDALSAFFLLVINFGGFATSLYALGYGRHEEAPGRVLPFFPAFLAGMNLVLLADDAFTFLLSWELMSVTSWALVIAHHADESNRRAGYIYIVMASFGTIALLLAFGILAGPGGSYAFDAIRASTHTPVIAALVLLLVVLGAGSKAGIVPLHIWLPLAHPAAPSHVSALMSGVMTKVAVYAFIRILFDLLHAPSWWSSVVVLFLGALTAVLGVLYALMQHDLKRLLAYHTVENIGIIFIGIGLALAFQAQGLRAAAALALTAALLHVLNHSLFKSLLFFGAGAVLTATHERDMERFGGLIHRMPQTAFAFLVGCVAISALPPFNGFVSEWLTFQAILLSPQLPQWALKIMIPAVGGLLALSAALAAACFVKAFGVTFLGRPRTAAAEQGREVDVFSRGAMFMLAALCLLIGILPALAIDALAPVSLSLLGSRMPVQSHILWLTTIPIVASRSSYNGLLVFIFITLSVLAAVFFIHNFASRALRRADPWDCGFPDPSPMTQYSAAGFAQPIRRVFGTLVFGARERVDMPAPGSLEPARLTVVVRDLIWERIYEPIGAFISYSSDRLNVLQFLTIRRYLFLVFSSLVVLLLTLALWS